MRIIREYIRKTLFDSSSILPAYRHDAPQGARGAGLRACGNPARAARLRRTVLCVDDTFALRCRRLQPVVPLRRGLRRAKAPEARLLLGYIVGEHHVFTG